jgi:Flp pilus assembly protein TadG
VVIVFPLLLLLIMLGIQFALWFHATHVAQAAAQEGARAARVCDGCNSLQIHDAGQVRTDQFLNALSPNILQNRQVAVVVNGNRRSVRVEVRGDALQVFWVKLNMPIHESSEGPFERFRGANEP